MEINDQGVLETGYRRPAELLTSEEAAALLKIDPKTLERMARLGEAPGFKLGKFWRWRAADLEAWINEKAAVGNRQSGVGKC